MVAPGFIDTDMTRVLSEGVRNDILNHVPLGHLGDPVDIANAVAFWLPQQHATLLVSTLRVNGGMYMP